jgi:lipopolysaccharide assembly protein A
MASHQTVSGGAGPGRGGWSRSPDDVPAEQGVPPPAGPWQPAAARDAASQPGSGPGAGARRGAEPAPVPGSQVLPHHHVLKRTRIGGVWLASGLFAVVLLFLLIFVLENGNKVEISYLGMHGHLPLGVALLLAAVLGVLLVAIPGTGRIIQLRATARRHRLIDAKAQDAGVEQAGNGPAGTGPAGSGPAGSGPAGGGPAGSGPAGSGPAGSGASAEALPRSS